GSKWVSAIEHVGIRHASRGAAADVTCSFAQAVRPESLILMPTYANINTDGSGAGTATLNVPISAVAITLQPSQGHATLQGSGETTIVKLEGGKPSQKVQVG